MLGAALNHRSILKPAALLNSSPRHPGLFLIEAFYHHVSNIASPSTPPCVRREYRTRLPASSRFSHPLLRGGLNWMTKDGEATKQWQRLSAEHRQEPDSTISGVRNASLEPLDKFFLFVFLRADGSIPIRVSGCLSLLAEVYVRRIGFGGLRGGGRNAGGQGHG